ncbi:hypothetical protein [Akkermansia muciniphila]|jgi:hypothetical protein|uniref:hypothetical protein n=1 Tax=Akkermansia muciniphila TaxID=239935 RepID=UPI001968A829|nr:hypothetical protein [Akkermansia muciniphila]QWP07700.1 hypothetical protein J5W75_11055 [Akkermansia muciniphila]QWP09966.1 hypothetical protein J5W68_11045 [Akkermansia muciniphila]QWP12226.1 hypothetical protein J5W62_11035 [Akkermansia muciniphila]QWP14707.1 hypothetical protein J5W66_00470 [Akkermansia muciniphila]QWP19126.1 hypothetical protein J5W65_10980 [Akkermansia muciniphila]
MDSGPSGRITRTERRKKTMSPERIAKKKKAVKKQNLTVVEKVALRNPILRKRRILASLWARLEKIEKRVPKSLEEAVEISRQSRRWRKRLSLFTKLKAVAIPSHALLVDCWGKELLLGAGTRKKMEALIDGSEAIRNAGYKLICLSNLAEEKQQVNKMKFIQGKEEQNND